MFLADGPGFAKARALKMHGTFRGMWLRAGDGLEERSGCGARVRGQRLWNTRVKLLDFPWGHRGTREQWEGEAGPGQMCISGRTSWLH